MKRGRKTLFALLLALVMTLGLAATAWATPGGGTHRHVGTSDYEKSGANGQCSTSRGNLHI